MTHLSLWKAMELIELCMFLRSGGSGAVRDDCVCHPVERVGYRGGRPRFDLGELGSRFQGEPPFLSSRYRVHADIELGCDVIQVFSCQFLFR